MAQRVKEIKMNKFKEFFTENGGVIGKSIINHIAMSIFGLMVCFSTMSINKVLFWVAGIFAIGMHMFLQYMIMWELGAKHNVRVCSDGERHDKLLGLKISLVKNALLILIAVLIIIFAFFKTEDASVVNSIYAALKASMTLFFESIYMPVLSVCDFSAIFLILIIPDLVCCALSYIAGLSGMKCIVPDRKKEKNQRR